MDDTLPSKSARTWAMWCHLGALSGYIGVPFGNLIVPGLIWVLKRDEDPFIDENGKEALNFHLSITLYIVISILLILAVVGIVFLIVLPIFSIVFTVIAAIKASDGERYRYPLTIRLFS